MAVVTQCDIGRRLQQNCSEDAEWIFINTFKTNIQEVLYQRIKRELKEGTTYDITTCCQFHNERFHTHYLEYQRTVVGCCNPFNIHVYAILDNLTTVDDEVREKLNCLEILEINERQICESCYSKVKRTLNEFVPLDDLNHGNAALYFPKKFRIETIQESYEKCIASGYHPFEPKLKDMQAYVLHHLFQNKDVLVTLPTNYGKTLPMVAATFMLSKVVDFVSVSFIDVM